MRRDYYNRLLASFIILGLIMTPALGISVSFNAGDGSGSTSSSATYKLDDSTSLQEQAVMAEGDIYQTRQASGSGNNSISSSVIGNGVSVSNTVDSSGHMGVSASAAATNEGAGISQSTSLSGKSGSVSFIASSKNNDMAVSSIFSGESSMNSDLSAVAADRAAMAGSATIAGVPVLESGNLDRVAAGDVGMSVDGLYAKSSGGLGEFSLNTINIEKTAASGTPSYLTGPAYSSSGGNSNAYILAGWRWNTRNPNIQWYLKSNTVPTNMNAASVQNAVSAAANTWNGASNQRLFNTAVTSTSSVNTDKRDGANVVAWKYLSEAPSALAYSRTWYNYNKVGGFYSAIESDISLNIRYPWSTSLPNGRPYYYNDPIDVQTVLTHEMGHTIGLGDLYGNTPYRSDYKQIMNSYNDVQRTLGNGDKTGAWVLYG